MMSVDDIRGQFPALGGQTVFMDNAGGSQVPAGVARRIHDYMRETYVQLGADYQTSLDCGAVVDRAHRVISTAMNGDVLGHVALGSSTSVLCAALADAYGRANRDGRDEIIVSDAGHEANIGPWLRLADRGYAVRLWPSDPETGRCALDELGRLLSDRTRLVAFHHVSNILGEILDVAAVTRLAHQAGARVVVDGVAYAPHRAMDVRAWGTDWYAFSLYKMYGPHMAALFGTREAFGEIEGPNHYFIDSSDPVYKFELGGVCHEGCAGVLGIAEYLSFLAQRSGVESLERSTVEQAFDVMRRLEEPLQARLLAYLGNRDDIRLVGPAAAGPARVPTISFVHRAHSARDIVLEANRRGYGIRYGHFYAHRLCRNLGLEPEDGVVRVSLVHYNALDEVDRLIACLEEIL